MCWANPWFSRQNRRQPAGQRPLALRSLGLIEDLTELPAADGRRFEPDPDRHGIYQEAVTRQQTLYASLQNCEL